MPIQIVAKAEAVLPFLSEISTRADAARDALGFLPEQSYETAALQGKLLLALDRSGNKTSYAGHLLFGGVYPYARVFQLHVAPEYRGKGVARQLMQALIKALVASSWMSIKAKVADDLPANSAWEAFGFRTVAKVPGGVTRNRVINVRVLDLDTPSLFHYMQGPKGVADLRLAERLLPRVPLYIIDLNVLFDIVRNRPRAGDAGKVICAALDDSIRLRVTEEFAEELKRTSRDPATDPILAIAKQIKRLPAPPTDVVGGLFDELSQVVFPDRSASNKLTQQDRSDIIHIITAIHHRVAGFITSEKAILRARPYLHERWAIDVVGVDEFARVMDADAGAPPSPTEVQLSTALIRALPCSAKTLAQARTFLEAMRVPAQVSEDLLGGPDIATQGVVVVDGVRAIGFARWEIRGGMRRTADLFVCVDEEHVAAVTVIDHLLDMIPRRLSAVSPTLVQLSVLPGHSATRRLALACGFALPAGVTAETAKLQRVAVGRPVSPADWGKIRLSLSSVAGVALPEKIPVYKERGQEVRVSVDGASPVSISLMDLERFLAPVLFLFQGRDGVIVPIQERFARDLFNSHPQLSLLAPPEAILRNERVYVSDPKTLSKMSPGTPILFYESKRTRGRGAVIAVARITESQVVSKIEVLESVQSRGVLTERTLAEIGNEKEVTETAFDNIFVLRRPVALARLQALGCDDGTHFVTATPVPASAVIEIVNEGWADA